MLHVLKILAAAVCCGTAIANRRPGPPKGAEMAGFGRAPSFFQETEPSDASTNWAVTGKWSRERWAGGDAEGLSDPLLIVVTRPAQSASAYGFTISCCLFFPLSPACGTIAAQKD